MPDQRPNGHDLPTSAAEQRGDSADSTPVRAGGRGGRGSPSECGDLARVLPSLAGTAVTATSTNYLLVSGPADEVKATLGLIAALDVEPPPVRPVRIKAIVRVSMPGAKTPPEFTTEDVVREGQSVRLEISSNAQVGETFQPGSGKRGVFRWDSGDLHLMMLLTPTIGTNNAISLSGAGNFNLQIRTQDSATFEKVFSRASQCNQACRGA